MKKSFVFILIGILCVFASAKVLFEDSFAEETDDWELGMTLEVYDDCLINEALGLSLDAKLVGEEFENCAISGTFEINEWGKNGALRILFRYNSLFESYWLSFFPSGVGVHRFTGSWESGVYLGGEDNPAFGSLGRHTFRIEVKDFTFKVFVDGKEELCIIDPEEAFLVGGLVLRFDDVAFSFDEIKVESL